MNWNMNLGAARLCWKSIAAVALFVIIPAYGLTAPTRIHIVSLRSGGAVRTVVRVRTRAVVEAIHQTVAPQHTPPYIGTVRTIVTNESQTYSAVGLSYDPATKTFYMSFVSWIDKIYSHGQVSRFVSSLCGGPIAFDGASELLYEYDPCNYEMNVIDQSGHVTFLAGGSQGTNDGTGSGAQFEGVTGITIDSATDTLYVSDGNAVRQVTTGGTVTTIAQVGSALGITFDSDDHNLYAASGSEFIDRVSSTGSVSWLSGRALCCYQEDGPPSLAFYSYPFGMQYSSRNKTLLVADSSNNQIRVVASDGSVTTLAGSGVPIVQDGVGSTAAFYNPRYVVFDPSSAHLYVASGANIRVVTTKGPAPPPPAHGISMTNPPTVPNGTNGVATASNGSIWLTETMSNKIGYVKADGSIREFPLPGGFGTPSQMTVGGDGNVWFINCNPPGIFPNNYIAKATQSGKVTEYPVASRNLTRGPDGNVWFTSTGVGYITPSGDVTEYIAGSTPNGVAGGFDGNIWTFSNWVFGQGEIDRISPTGILLNQYIINQTGTYIASLVAGPDNRMWFVTDGGQQIAAMTLDGNATYYDLPLTPGCNAGCRGPANLTLGRDGAIWFTEEISSIPAGGIGRLTTTGSFSDFQVPAPRSSPSAITFAPDGSLWFADPGAHKLGHLF